MQIVSHLSHVIAQSRKVFRITGLRTDPRIGDVEVRNVPAFDERAKLDDQRKVADLTECFYSQCAGVVKFEWHLFALRLTFRKSKSKSSASNEVNKFLFLAVYLTSPDLVIGRANQNFIFNYCTSFCIG